MDAQVRAALCYLKANSDNISGAETNAALELARELHNALVERSNEQHSERCIRFFVLHESKCEFMVDMERTGAHMLFGRQWGQKVINFITHKTTCVVNLLLYTLALGVTLAAFMTPVHDELVILSTIYVALANAGLVLLLNTQVVWKVVQTFEYWYLCSQVISAFAFLIPMSFNWDVRSPLSSLWGVCVCLALLSDALPPIFADLVRQTWVISCAVFPLVAAGFHLDWFHNSLKPRIEMGGISWDVHELLTNRLLVLTLFGLRDICKFWRPHETNHLKVSLLRGDKNGSFLLQRKLGLLPPVKEEGEHACERDMERARADSGLASRFDGPLWRPSEFYTSASRRRESEIVSGGSPSVLLSSRGLGGGSFQVRRFSLPGEDSVSKRRATIGSQVELLDERGWEGTCESWAEGEAEEVCGLHPVPRRRGPAEDEEEENGDTEKQEESGEREGMEFGSALSDAPRANLTRGGPEAASSSPTQQPSGGIPDALGCPPPHPLAPPAAIEIRERLAPLLYERGADRLPGSQRGSASECGGEEEQMFATVVCQ